MKKNISGFRVVDLFSGGGGLSLGFINAGFNVVASFDNWPAAIDLHRKNFKHPTVQCDLGDPATALAAIRPFSPDIVVGGPPCQDFSSAGKRDEDGGRANLTMSFAQIVAEILPQYFIMENVDRAIKSKTFSNAVSVFKSAGYGLTVRVMDASLCGVPQTRKRLFVVGARGGRDDEVTPFLLHGISASPMSVREYFGSRLSIDHYYRHPRSYKRRGIFSVDEPSPTIRGVNRPVPDGYPGHSGDPVKIGPAIRPLTTRERAMIQTFPEDFVLCGSRTELEQIIGNAVPVKLAEHVANALKSFIVESGSNSKEIFKLYEHPGEYIASAPHKRVERSPVLKYA